MAFLTIDQARQGLRNGMGASPASVNPAVARSALAKAMRDRGARVRVPLVVRPGGQIPVDARRPVRVARPVMLLKRPAGMSGWTPTNAYDTGIYDSLPVGSQYQVSGLVTEPVVMPGNLSVITENLDSHMQMWTADNTAPGLSPGSVAVANPAQWPAMAAVEASSYCQSFPVSDCGQQAAIAQKYGAVLQGIWNWYPDSVWQAVAANGGSSGLISPARVPSYFIGAPAWAVSALSVNPYVGSNATSPVPVVSPISTVVNVQPAAGQASTPNTTVSIQNTSRPWQSLQVGDSWQVTVTGAPNSQVAASSVQNGNDLGSAVMGSTDSTGVFHLSGVMDASTIGTWSEVWSVGTGGGQTAMLNFTVSPAPGSAVALPVPSTISPATPIVSSPMPVTASTGSPAAVVASVPVSSPSGSAAPLTSDLTSLWSSLNLPDFSSSWFQQTLTIGGLGIPYWAIGLGVVALFFFGGRRR